MNRRLIQSLALGIGIVAGWFAIGDKEPPSQTGQTEIPQEVTTSSMPSNEPPPPVEEDSPTISNAKVATLIARANTPAELVALYKQLNESNIRRTPFWDLLMTKLVRADPQLAMRNVFAGDRASVLGKIAVADPILALELLAGLDTESANSLRGSILMTLAANHPRLALEQIEAGNTDGVDTRWAENAALRAVATTDPQAALTWLADCPASRKEELTRELLAGWVQHSPKEAIDWSLKNTPPGLKPWKHPVGRALQEWSASEPGAAMKAMLALNDRRLIAQFADDVFGRAAKSDPQGVFDFVENHPELREDLRIQALASATAALAKKDPALAAEKMTGLSGHHRANAEEAIVTALAEDDPDAAYEWAIKQRPDAPHELVGNLLWKIASEDPEQGQALLSRSLAANIWDDHTDQIYAVPAIFSNLVKKDPDAAVAWLNEVSASLPKAVFDRSLELENVSPDVLEKLMIAMPDSDFSEVVSKTAGERARNKPDTVARWIDTLPAGEMRDTAIANAAIGIAQADLDLATTWAESLPAGRARERAIHNVATIYSEFGEPPPLEFILQAGEKERDELLTNHFALAAQKDPEAARAALEKLDHPDAEFFEGVIAAPWRDPGGGLRFK